MLNDKYNFTTGEEIPKTLINHQAIYKNALNPMVWTSDYWYKKKDVINYSSKGMDKDDPQSFLEFTSGRNDSEWKFLGDGICHMKGTYPRLYITNSNYKNVECTMYYRNNSGLETKDTDGADFGCRSHLLGHRDENYFKYTHTYYGRLRGNGTGDLAKEAHHREDFLSDGFTYDTTYRTWGNGKYRKTKKIFGGGNIPSGQWIGWKVIVSNIKGSEGKKILLQTWIDVKSNGEPEKYAPENWQCVETLIDEYGKFPTAPSTIYEYYGTDPKSIYDNTGIVFIRNSWIPNYGADYKDIVVREIDEINEECIITNPSFTPNYSILTDYFNNLIEIVKYVFESILKK